MVTAETIPPVQLGTHVLATRRNHHFRKHRKRIPANLHKCFEGVVRADLVIVFLQVLQIKVQPTGAALAVQIGQSDGDSTRVSEVWCAVNRGTVEGEVEYLEDHEGGYG